MAFNEPKRLDPVEMRKQYINDALGNRPKEYATKILAAVEENIPTINESAFKARVIPLLERILVPANQQAYFKIVVDRLMPLKVVADDDKTKVLHIVPSISRSPLTTVPQLDGGLTVGDVIYNLNRYRDLNRNDLIEGTVKGYLENITILPDLIDDILLPIHRILQTYGKELDVTANAENPLGKSALPPTVKLLGVTTTLSQSSSSFTDEEDED